MTPNPWADGEGPSNRGQAKKDVEALLEKPEHKKAKGSPEDESTRDDAIDDPKHQKGDAP